MNDDSALWLKLSSVMNAYVVSEALAAACGLGLFGVLSGTAKTSPEVARALGLSAHSTRVLLLGCRVAGAIETDGSGLHRNADWAEHFLVPGKATSMLNFVKFNHDVQDRGLARLEASLKEDRPLGLLEFPGEGGTLYERLAGTPELEGLFHRAMAEYSLRAPKVTAHASFDGMRSLLDVGGANGAIAQTLCERHSELTVTILDRPSVCEIGELENRGRAVGDRIRFVPADFLSDPWPGSFDAVLFSHVVEIFGEPEIRALYRQAHEALSPGGKTFIWTLTTDDEEKGGLQAAKSSLYFVAVASGRGMAYPGSDHVRWLKEAGYVSTERIAFPEMDHSLVIASKAP